MGKLRLYHHSQLICCPKGRFRRTPGMKTHAIYAIRSIDFEDFFPFCFCHGWMTFFRKYTAVRLSPEKKSSSIKRQSETFIYAENANAKSLFPLIQQLFSCQQLCIHRIDIPFLLIPFSTASFQWNLLLKFHPAPAEHNNFSQKGLAAKTQSPVFPNLLRRGNLSPYQNTIFHRINPKRRKESLSCPVNRKITQNSVPVGLCLIRSRRRRQNRIDRPAGIFVVHRELHFYQLTGKICNFKHIRSAQTSLFKNFYLFSIDKKSQLSRPFHFQKKSASLCRRKPYFSAVPGASLPGMQSCKPGCKLRRIFMPHLVSIQRTRKINLTVRKSFSFQLPFSPQIKNLFHIKSPL